MVLFERTDGLIFTMWPCNHIERIMRVGHRNPELSGTSQSVDDFCLGNLSQ